MKRYNIESKAARVNYSVHGTVQIPVPASKQQIPTITCPSCGHIIQLLHHHHHHHHHQSSAILEDLPAGVKFDPTDQEILQHLEAKELMSTATTGAAAATRNQLVHPLIDEFIPTIDGENGICYTHPEKLPGVSKDGQIRHFFHRPSKAYTTGTRKRRKVHTDNNGGETRWHKTGKTRPIIMTTEGGRTVKGYKKILVLYTNYGRQRKPEKTNWVMHQYHLGEDEEEKDGELVVSKVFYQTQPRQVHGKINEAPARSNLTLPAPATLPPPPHYGNMMMIKNIINPSYFMDQYNYGSQNRDSTTADDDQLILPNIIVHGDHDGSSSFIQQLPSGVSKDKL